MERKLYLRFFLVDGQLKVTVRGASGDYMNLVQIAASVEYGAYYYDFSTNKIYHVPHEDLLELNHVRFANLTGWLIGSAVVVTGMVKYVKNLRYSNRSHSLLLLLTVLVLSSCLFYGLAKSNQKRISHFIRDRYRAVNENLDLRQIVRHGRKAYVQISVYCVFLFFFAVVSLSESVTSASALFAFFSIVFFDTGVMMITILQPLGKIAAYFNIKRKYDRR